MKQLSIIIPATGSQPDIDDTLVSVLENCPDDCEILLVHPRSYVDPYDLGDEVRLVVSEETGVLALLNQGLHESRGSVVHVLTPGVTVASGWCDEALELFAADRNIGSVAPTIVAKGSRRTIQGVDYHVRCGKSVVTNSKRRILGPLVVAGFYQASAIRFMRGFDTLFGECADVELGLRLRSANYQAAKCDSRIHSREKLIYKPQRGFDGGKQRGELSRIARRLGLSTSTQGCFALLGESVNNRFGLSTIASMFGHVSTWVSKTSDNTQPLDVSKPQNKAGRKREAA